MASDRVTKIAVEFVKPFCTESDDHDYPQHNCRKCMEMAERLTTVLDALERETRLDELREIDRLAAGQRGFKTAWRIVNERIAELAAQPTPEVKK